MYMNCFARHLSITFLLLISIPMSGHAVENTNLVRIQHQLESLRSEFLIWKARLGEHEFGDSYPYLPDRVKELLVRGVPHNEAAGPGPNCSGTSYYVNYLRENCAYADHDSSLIQLQNCRFLPNEEPRPGDIGAIFRNGDPNGPLRHTFLMISSVMVFEKRDDSRETPWELSRTDDTLRAFGALGASRCNTDWNPRKRRPTVCIRYYDCLQR